MWHQQQAENSLEHYNGFELGATTRHCTNQSPSFYTQRLRAEQDQLPWGSIGTSPGNCQEAETCMARACHTPRQPLQSHPSGHLGGWATPWSAEEKLDGQHQRVDISARARTAHKGLLQKGPEEDLCWIVPHVPPTTQSAKELNWTEQLECDVTSGKRTVYCNKCGLLRPYRSLTYLFQ